MYLCVLNSKVYISKKCFAKFSFLSVCSVIMRLVNKYIFEEMAYFQTKLYYLDRSVSQLYYCSDLPNEYSIFSDP